MIFVKTFTISIYHKIQKVLLKLHYTFVHQRDLIQSQKYFTQALLVTNMKSVFTSYHQALLMVWCIRPVYVFWRSLVFLLDTAVSFCTFITTGDSPDSFYNSRVYAFWGHLSVCRTQLLCFFLHFYHQALF